MPTQLTTGDLVTAANWNTIPGGKLDYTIRTTAFNNITGASTMITGSAFTAPSGRLLKVTFQGRISANSASGVSAQVSDGTTIKTVWTTDLLDVANKDIGFSGWAMYTATGASMTFTAIINEYLSGSVNLIPDTSYPAALLVEDVGAA